MDNSSNEIRISSKGKIKIKASNIFLYLFEIVKNNSKTDHGNFSASMTCVPEESG